MIPLRYGSAGAGPAVFVAVALVSWLQLGCSQPTTTLPPSSPALSLEEPLPTAGHSARRVAWIALSGEPTAVQIPSAAVANEPIGAVVTTYGGGCIGEDTTVVDVRGRVADVVPYQRVYQPRANEGCTMELRVNRRQVRLVFAEPGLATVRVFGRGAGDTVAVVTRQVEVRQAVIIPP